MWWLLLFVRKKKKSLKLKLKFISSLNVHFLRKSIAKFFILITIIGQAKMLECSIRRKQEGYLSYKKYDCHAKSKQQIASF